jgi:HEPN domain-containing protein
MNNISLKDSVDEHMQFIDDILNEQKIPIYNRYMNAAIMYVKMAIVSSSHETEDEFIKSETFYKGILPVINEWYFLKYGKLTKDPKSSIFKGLVFISHQPFLIEFPATTSKVKVPNESSWLTFPDHFQDSESINKIICGSLEIDNLCSNDQEKVTSQLIQVVSLTRKINLNIMSATNLDNDSSNMASGILQHFDKAISDILSHQDEKASVASWEFHLAVEKSFKVYLKDKTGKKEYGHELNKLAKLIKDIDPQIDLTLISKIPSDKDAIKLRYAEKISTLSDIFEHYLNSLELVNSITSLLSREIRFNNSSILINKAPWATT